MCFVQGFLSRDPCPKSRDLHSSLEKIGRVLGMDMVTPDLTVVGSWTAAEEVVWLRAGP